MIIDNFLNLHGISYTVSRSSKSEIGLPNHEPSTKRAYISFRPGTDIQIGDCLKNPAGDIFYVTEIQTDFFHKQPRQLKAYYQTEAERNAASLNNQSVYNIQHAYGSVIGSSNNAIINYQSTIADLKYMADQDTSDDKEELEKIISLLEMIVNDQIPLSKGLFAKFSQTMERHSWLSSSVAGAIMSWLTTA